MRPAELLRVVEESGHVAAAQVARAALGLLCRSIGQCGDGRLILLPKLLPRLAQHMGHGIQGVSSLVFLAR